MAAPTREETWTLSLGGSPLLTFANPSGAALADLRGHFGPLVRPGAAETAVCIRFEPIGRRGPRSLLELRGFQVAADDDGRFLLRDHAGNAAELPVNGDETELRVDPSLDAGVHGAFHQYVMRLIEWQAARHGMVLVKGGAVTLPEGTVALIGYQRSGKTSTLMALLEDAVAYLGEDRLVLCGPKALAAFPARPELSLGRQYSLPPATTSRLAPRDRWLLRVAPAAVGALPRRLRGRAVRELAERWVVVDLNAFPHVRVPVASSVDSLVFLVPYDGGDLSVEPLDATETYARAAQHMVSIIDAYFVPMGSMFEFAFPGRGPWPVIDRDEQLTRLRSALDGVPGWILRVPPGTPAGEAASAVRRTLGR